MVAPNVANGLIQRLISTFGLAIVLGHWSTAAAQNAESKRFDLRIEDGRVSNDLQVIRVRRGDTVEIKWSTDRRTVLHLHGYDIETIVESGKPQTMSFTARATGRFPIETHGNRHFVVIYLEVYPR